MLKLCFQQIRQEDVDAICNGDLKVPSNVVENYHDGNVVYPGYLTKDPKTLRPGLEYNFTSSFWRSGWVSADINGWKYSKPNKKTKKRKTKIDDKKKPKKLQKRQKTDPEVDSEVDSGTESLIIRYDRDLAKAVALGARIAEKNRVLKQKNRVLKQHQSETSSGPVSFQLKRCEFKPEFTIIEKPDQERVVMMKKNNGQDVRIKLKNKKQLDYLCQMLHLWNHCGIHMDLNDKIQDQAIDYMDTSGYECLVKFQELYERKITNLIKNNHVS